MPLCTIHIYGMYCSLAQWIAVKPGKLILLVSAVWTTSVVIGLIPSIYDLRKDVRSIEVLISPSCSYYLSGYSLVMNITLSLQLVALLLSVMILVYCNIKICVLIITVKTDLQSAGGRRTGTNHSVLALSTVLFSVCPFGLAVLQSTCICLGLAETTSDNQQATLLSAFVLPMSALISPFVLFFIKVKRFVCSKT